MALVAVELEARGAGRRASSRWIRHYDWLATAADPGFSARFVFSLARQRAHLKRALRTGLVGHEAVAALKALIFVDLAFLRDGKRFEKSLEQTLRGSPNS